MLAYAIAFLSVGILGAIVAMLFYYRPKKPWEKFLLWLYFYNLVHEGVMIYTSLSGYRNHVYANVHVVVFGIAMWILLIGIWERRFKKKFPRIMAVLVPVFFVVTGLIDNFVIHVTDTFNPLAQAIIFIVNLCFVVYMLSVLLFIKAVDSLYQFDKLLVFAFLVHCFGAIIIDIFFNYYIDLPENLYLVLGMAGQIIGVITNILVLLSIRCLIINKKYSLR